MSSPAAARPGGRQPGAAGRSGAARTGEAARAARRRAILDLVAAREIGSQEELAGLLRGRGFAVTQATVSRDISDLGLVKAPRGSHHAYVTPGVLAGTIAAAGGGAGAAARGGAGAAARGGAGAAGGEAAPGSLADPGESRLLHILADNPVTIARSGLTLVLVGRPGAASAIAQAIDESSLDDQVGTLAGDNTLLILFADEPALERWRTRFGAIAARAAAGTPGNDLTTTYP
jgi:transcriptional regulator of arginine metabolism